jgi:myo-inositol-1(or 4)-monophosphatase
MTSPPPELAHFLPFAERLADAARAQTLPRFRAGGAVTDKGAVQFDPVTEADREGERAIRAMIGAHHPEHGVIGEEFGAERETAEWRWVLDPVDGTRAFICGAATWTTLIALEHRGAPLVGVIDQPFTDERWIGAPGGAVHRREGRARSCRVSAVAALADARISTTDPRDTAYFSAGEAAAFQKLAQRCRVARFSFDAYAYGLLALGELDLVVESSLKHHDYAALKPVVENAGGVITDWDGAPLGACARGRVVAAATRELHGAALELLRSV